MRIKRRIEQADALVWMDTVTADSDASVVTSLPDVSEMSHLDLDEWRIWFIGAARRILRWLPPTGVAIFYQSDVRHRGQWIDKGYLVMRAADEEAMPIAWHKIVCRKPVGTISLGRPGYSHMICVGHTTGPSGPDILPSAGLMPWSKAMGMTACELACRFLREQTKTGLIVDPFCGRGTVLAVANSMGFDAIGVDISRKRCRDARSYMLPQGTS